MAAGKSRSSPFGKLRVRMTNLSDRDQTATLARSGFAWHGRRVKGILTQQEAPP